MAISEVPVKVLPATATSEVSAEAGREVPVSDSQSLSFLAFSVLVLLFFSAGLPRCFYIMHFKSF